MKVLPISVIFNWSKIEMDEKYMYFSLIKLIRVPDRKKGNKPFSVQTVRGCIYSLFSLLTVESCPPNFFRIKWTTKSNKGNTTAMRGKRILIANSPSLRCSDKLLAIILELKMTKNPIGNTNFFYFVL